MTPPSREQCPTCRELPPNGYSDKTRVNPNGQLLFEQNVNFEINAGRPVNVTQFRDLKVCWRDDCSLYTLFLCPLCRSYYRHEYHYDSGGGAGPAFESQELVLLEPEALRNILTDQGELTLLEDWGKRRKP